MQYIIHYMLYIIRYILHIIYYIMLPFDMLPASADLLCCFEETEKLNGEIQIKRRKISLQWEKVVSLPWKARILKKSLTQKARSCFVQAACLYR